jgi:hypothetical protein
MKLQGNIAELERGEIGYGQHSDYSITTETTPIYELQE